MPAFTFQITAIGAADQDDKNAALYAIGLENARRAALVPPGTPLPTSNPAEIKSSYQTILATVVSDIHSHNLSQSNISTLQDVRALWPAASDAKRAAALAALQA